MPGGLGNNFGGQGMGGPVGMGGDSGMGGPGGQMVCTGFGSGLNFTVVGKKCGLTYLLQAIFEQAVVFMDLPPSISVYSLYPVIPLRFI